MDNFGVVCREKKKKKGGRLALAIQKETEKKNDKIIHYSQRNVQFMNSCKAERKKKE